jgi:hypothetical protein
MFGWDVGACLDWMLMSEAPLRMTLEQCKANIASHLERWLARSAAYTVGDRGLRLMRRERNESQHKAPSQ